MEHRVNQFYITQLKCPINLSSLKKTSNRLDSCCIFCITCIVIITLMFKFFELIHA
jgi:hypothetical protein